ncbi:MAG TPA: TolC family protein [Mucilaginibacter sp.]|jgi:outer membrane protein|nr:TolC family protein [Mucilaginibacter sp.]
MRFSKYFITLLFLAGAATAFAQQNNVLTLQQCLQIAIRNNLTAKQDSVTAEQQRIAFLQAKENLLPSLTSGANRALTSGRALNPVTNAYITQSVTSDNYSANASITVFNGLALQNAIKQASLAYQSGKMNFQAAKDVVTVNVITNYLQVLDARDVLNQDTSQLAVAKESLDRSEILESHGDNKFASDVYDLRGSYQSAKVNLVVAQNALDAAVISLYQLMNIPYNKDVQLQPLNAEDMQGENGINPDDVYNTALQQLAQMKAATLMRQSAEKQVSYYRGLLWPQLTLGSGISTNYSNLNTGSYFSQFRNNYGTYVQIGLNVPIFTNLYRRNNVALAKLNLLNQQYVEDNTKIVLKQNIEQAYYNMAAAYRRYQALIDETKAYAESFRISKIRYEAGVLNSVDFVTSKNNMDGANLALISARYDYIIYSKILDYYQGKLASF